MSTNLCSKIFLTIILGLAFIRILSISFMLELKKRPIRMLYLTKPVFWLDDFGSTSAKIILKCCMTLRPAIYVLSTFYLLFLYTFDNSCTFDISVFPMPFYWLKYLLTCLALTLLYVDKFLSNFTKLLRMMVW